MKKKHLFYRWFVSLFTSSRSYTFSFASLHVNVMLKSALWDATDNSTLSHPLSTLRSSGHPCFRPLPAHMQGSAEHQSSQQITIAGRRLLTEGLISRGTNTGVKLKKQRSKELDEPSSLRVLSESQETHLLRDETSLLIQQTQVSLLLSENVNS